jgi:hypothetical protein
MSLMSKLTVMAKELLQVTQMLMIKESELYTNVSNYTDAHPLDADVRSSAINAKMASHLSHVMKPI